MDIDNYNIMMHGGNYLNNEIYPQNNDMYLNMSANDIMFVGMLAIVILIILFSTKPIVADAVDNVQHDMQNNRVADYVMSNLSNIYVLNKQDTELKSALQTIKTPLQSSSTISSIKKSIDKDMNDVITRNTINDVLKLTTLESVENGDRIGTIIAYSIVNRLRKLTQANKEKDKIKQNYDNRNLIAIDLMDSACTMVSDLENTNNTDIADNNLLIMTANNLILISAKMIASVNEQVQQYALEQLVQDRVESEKKNSDRDFEDEPIPNEYMSYDLVMSVLHDKSDLLNGKADSYVVDININNDSDSDSNNHNHNHNPIKSTIENIKNKKASIYSIIFEMAWIMGGGPIRQDCIYHVKSIGNDFGIISQLHEDFSNYYSDQVNKSSINYVLEVGTDEAYNEFFNRISSFVEKLEYYNIMTNCIKHVINHLSDSVTLAYKMISDDAKSNDTDTDTDTDDNINNSDDINDVEDDTNNTDDVEDDEEFLTEDEE